MRPIRLLMSAFGPYSHEQSIDFRQLGGHRFFLIHGPTGSGKTTILDAICYALFGESSGSEREGEQMRSHFAAASVPTFVEFDFSVGQKTFRARRRPKQPRLKKGGEGTTIEPGGATLWDLTRADHCLDDATVIASQPSRVTIEVERVLGFGVEQFRQVILLPQDKFRDLLMADSSRREDILQTLFQTQFYEQVQERLKEGSRALRSRVEQVRHEVEVLFGQAASKDLDELMVIRAARANESATLAEVVLKLKADEEAVQNQLHAARADKLKLDERDAANVDVVKVESNAAAIVAARRSADAARRAAALAPREALLRERRSQEKARRHALQAAERTLADTAAAHEKALSDLSAWNTRSSEREAFHAEVVRLEGLREQVGRVEQADKLVDEAANRLAASRLLEAGSATELKGAEARLAAVTDALCRAKESLAGSQSAELVLSNASRQLNDRRILDELRISIHEHTCKHSVANENLHAARERIRDMKAELADLQRAYIHGHAAQLAKKLVNGAPCPVCGAVEHPAPATSDQPVPPWEQVEQRQREVDQKQNEADILVRSASILAEELAGKRATEQALMESLADASGELLPILMENQESARKQVEAIKIALRQMPALEDASVESKTKREWAMAAHEQHLQARRAAETEVVARRATRDEAVKGVPESLSTLKTLETAAAAAVEKLKRLDERIAAAERAAQSAAAIRQAAAEQKKSAAAELESAARMLEQSGSEFARQREDAGFLSEHEFEAAKLDDTRLRALEDRISAHEQALGAARDRAERASTAALGVSPPDLDAMSGRLAEVKKSLEATVTSRATTQESLKRIDQLIRDITETKQRLADLEAEYSIVGRVADVATGNNGARLTFQRYVLSSMLDQVTETASVRLQLMSSGRYQLRRKLVPIDQRSHGGLDLEVLDAHTGVCRAAETLSGGESFLASLSLALGLADVVARHAGSMRMETMFIDEGFGSLDAESLELAISTLVDLMSDGRIVGIISHVPELRERIDARLEIVSTRSGSAARFVAPSTATAPARVMTTLFGPENSL